MSLLLIQLNSKLINKSLLLLELEFKTAFFGRVFAFGVDSNAGKWLRYRRPDQAMPEGLLVSCLYYIIYLINKR